MFFLLRTSTSSALRWFSRTWPNSPRIPISGRPLSSHHPTLLPRINRYEILTSGVHSLVSRWSARRRRVSRPKYSLFLQRHVFSSVWRKTRPATLIGQYSTGLQSHPYIFLRQTSQTSAHVQRRTRLLSRVHTFTESLHVCVVHSLCLRVVFVHPVIMSNITV